MAISRTPYRMSFFGGGTDFPDWYLEHGGAVLSMAINQYCYITGRHLLPFFGVRHRVVWSHIENVNTISEILHPAVRAGLEAMRFDDESGVELHHQGDLPARSGIGSSSAFAVGLINVLSAMRGADIGKHELALAAIDLERNKLKETVGCQDQIASAFGGLNVIRFLQDGSFSVAPVNLTSSHRAVFEDHLMVFYTGTTRLSSSISQQLVDNIGHKAKTLERMQAMVPEAVSMLRCSDIEGFGRLLNQAWSLKRSLASSISTTTIDRIYDDALMAGALGGKLLGAGGAGFMVFIVPLEHQGRVRSALSHLLYVPVRTDFTGSTIVYRREDQGPHPAR